MLCHRGWVRRFLCRCCSGRCFATMVLHFRRRLCRRCSGGCFATMVFTLGGCFAAVLVDPLLGWMLGHHCLSHFGNLCDVVFLSRFFCFSASGRLGWWVVCPSLCFLVLLVSVGSSSTFLVVLCNRLNSLCLLRFGMVVLLSS